MRSRWGNAVKCSKKDEHFALEWMTHNAFRNKFFIGINTFRSFLFSKGVARRLQNLKALNNWKHQGIRQTIRERVHSKFSAVKRFVIIAERNNWIYWLLKLWAELECGRGATILNFKVIYMEGVHWRLKSMEAIHWKFETPKKHERCSLKIQRKQ